MRNPFGIVLNNAVNAAKSGISIELRLNVDEKNREDLLRLIDELKVRLENVPNVRVYARMLYGEYENPRSYEAYYEVRSALEKSGISKGTGIPRRIYSCISIHPADRLPQAWLYTIPCITSNVTFPRSA